MSNRQSLRICILNPEEPSGGPSGTRRVALEMTRALAELGADCHLLTPIITGQSTGERHQAARHHHVRVRFAPTGALAGHAAGRALYFSAAMWRAVDRLHAEAPVDVVLAPVYGGLGLVCGCDDRLTTVTRLFTTSVLDSASRPGIAGRRATHARAAMERAAVVRARHLQAATRAIVTDVADWVGPPLPEPILIPLGVADQARGRAPARAGEGKLTVLFVGRLERRKGVDVLLEVARRVVADLPDARFVLAGPDSLAPEGAESFRQAFLDAASGDRRLLERVVFEGEVSDERLWELYAGCDVFCAPSRYESFGNVLIEGMMFGKPVVACRAGGMPEVVEEGVSGLLAEPGEAESLERCLRSLLADADLRARMGAAARERWERQFRLEAVAQTTLERYRELAGASGRRDADGQQVSERVAAAIAEVTGLPAAAARHAATELLERDPEIPDLVTDLERLWLEPSARFVAGLYRACLAREPEPDEVEAWLSALRARHRRLEVLQQLLSGHEAAVLGVDPGTAARLAARLPRRRTQWVRGAMKLPAPEFVEVLFRALLDRDPDPAGLADWLGALNAGAMRETVVDQIARSPEAREIGVAA